MESDRDTSLGGKEMSLIQAVRRWPKITAYSFALTSAIILGGFDISIISSVASLPQFQLVYGQEFGDTYIIPALWLGLWNGGVPIGAIAGSLFGGFFQDKVGRRWSMAAASLLSAGCVAIAYLSDLSPMIDTRRAVFLIAKTLQGFGNGMILCTAETYMSETLPMQLRGPGLALFPIFTLVGQLIGSIVVQTALALPGASSYRTCFAAQWPFAFFALVVALVVPESPPWLIRNGRHELAFRNHKRLESVKNPAAAEAAFRELQGAVILEQKRASSESVTYMQCFYGVDRRRTVIVVFAMALPYFFGLPLFATASYFLQTIGMDAATSIIFVIIGVVLGLVSNIGAFWTLTAFGRRWLMLGSLSISTVLWTSVGIAGCFSGNAMLWYASVCMMVILLILGLSAWPASFVVAGETSSLRLRARTQGLAGCAGNVVAGVLSIVLPYIYNPDQGRLGARVGFVFAAFCALSVAAVWKLIPEMKGRSAAEIDEMFELRLDTRQFKSWSADTDDVGLSRYRDTARLHGR